MQYNVTRAVYEQLPDVLRLIQRSFAYMDSRIDPPSSMHRLDLPSVVQRFSQNEVYVIGDQPEACMFVQTKGKALYLGKTAVRTDLRGSGRFAALIEKAENLARSQNLEHLEIETRIELTKVHAAFERHGFVETAKGAHNGYDHPTFLVMKKPIGYPP